MPLLTPNPKIGPGFKSNGDLVLDGHTPTDFELNEHTTGGFSCAFFQTHHDGRRDMLLLDSKATAQLRRYLNRAYRERTRR